MENYFNCKKFMSFDNSKVTLSEFFQQENANSDHIIISMIGCARVGKSTFINGLLSYLLNKNINVVNTSSSSDHCTTGIDYISIDYELGDEIGNIYKIIILDCQGLSYQDSKNDDKLLSVIYMLSDIVVFHETGIINNQTLNTLTLLCLVADYIKFDNVSTKNKPILFFRMKDYNLTCDPKEILDKTFETQNDQYDKVRGAINKLFPTIYPLTTDPLGKSEIKKLKDGIFIDILKDDEYNFISSYNKILKCALNIKKNSQNKQIKTIESLYKNATNVATKLNTNEKMSFNDYDYYSLLIKQRFSDYWESIDHSIYDPIFPTKFEKTYQECNQRINIMNLEIKKFLEVFNEVEKTLLDDECDKIIKKIEPHITTSRAKCLDLASEYIISKIPNLLNYLSFNVFSPRLITNGKLTFDISSLENLIEKSIENIIIINNCNGYEQIEKLDNELCLISINSIQKMVKNDLDIIIDQIIGLQDEQRCIINKTIDCTMSLLEKTANVDYVKYKIYNNKKLHYENHTRNFNIIKNEIYNEVVSTLENIVSDISFTKLNYCSNKISLVYVSKFAKKEQVFDELINHIKYKIYVELFTESIETLKNIYKECLISSFGINNVSQCIMCAQTLINFTILLLPKEKEYCDILSEITNTIIEDCKYNQTDENVNIFLKKLSDYVELDFNFVKDKLLHDTSTCYQNIKKYCIDYNSIYGKFFINKILEKYVMKKYSTNVSYR